MTDTKPEPEDEVDASKMPLLDHLIELRKRLIWSFAAIVVCFIGWYFVAPYIYNLLMHPMVVALGGRVPAFVVAVAYQLFWRAQYSGHKKRVKAHFAQPQLKPGF